MNISIEHGIMHVYFFLNYTVEKKTLKMKNMKR